MKLLQKLLEIQKAIDFLEKNKSGHQYKYVDGTRVLSAIRPMMNEHGLILKQEIISTEHETITYATRSGEKTEVLAKVRFRFTWVDAETGDTDVNEWAADGMNGFDKGIGSAMTYAERYFLLKYFHIPTDELDNDALGEKAGDKQPSKAKPTPPPADAKTIIQLLESSSTKAELKARWEKLTPAEQKLAGVTEKKDELKTHLP